MAENLKITAEGKEEKYKELLPQIISLLQNENDLIANLANTCAALKYGMNFFWAGFYFVKGNAGNAGRQELVLGPFQGPIACTRIAKGKGVCGVSWEKKQTMIVEDVDKFPGHISCSALSKSEIVIPIFNSKKNVIAILDVDSDVLNSFDKTDEFYLKEIIKRIKF
jgi:L-methionine (R)-S-oxide reductase